MNQQLMPLSSLPLRGRTKGQLGNLQVAAVGLVVIAIVIGFGAQILGNIRTTQTAGTAEYNATTSGIGALDTFSDNLGTIALIIVAVVVIGLLLRSFGGRSRA